MQSKPPWWTKGLVQRRRGSLQQMGPSHPRRNPKQPILNYKEYQMMVRASLPLSHMIDPLSSTTCNFLSGWYSRKGIFPWVFFVAFYSFVTILSAFTSLLKWGDSALSTFTKITRFKSSDIWISLFKYQASSASPSKYSLSGKVSILVRPGQP